MISESENDMIQKALETHWQPISPISNTFDKLETRISDNSRVGIDLSSLGTFIQEILQKASTKNFINLKSFKLYTRKEVNLDRKLSLEELSDHGIPIVDYYIYWNLAERFIPVSSCITISNSIVPYTEIDAMKCLLFTYLNFMKYNRIALKESEKLPGFAKRLLDLNLPISEINRIISLNNIEDFDHSWVKTIDVSKLGMPVISKLKKGICGSKLFNIFRDFKWKANLPLNIETACLTIKNIAKNGPFLEMHPSFLPKKLIGCSISKNLKNLIITAYSYTEIEFMKSKGLVCKSLKYDIFVTDFMTWNETFEALFVTKVCN